MIASDVLDHRASFGARCLALAIDWVILAVVTSILGNLLAGLLGVAIGFLYFAICWFRWGQTIGQRIVHIRVEKLDGSALTFGGAALRSLGLWLSTFAAGIGLVWAAFDERSQGWHDKMVGTVVVDSSTTRTRSATSNVSQEQSIEPTNATQPGYSVESFMNPQTNSDRDNAPLRAAKAKLARLGSTHAERVTAINNLFDERTATVDATYQYRFKYSPVVWGHVFFRVSCNLSNMDNRRREYLRIAELLNSAAEGEEEVFRLWRASLVWADGKGQIDRYHDYGDKNDSRASAVTNAFSAMEATLEQTVIAMSQYREKLRANGSDPTYRQIAEEASERLSTGGGSWLKPEQIPTTLFARTSDFAVHIGSLLNGTPLTYSGDGSMVTIAPPGSGKTQCHVFPNLLTWQGPAVVLDVSGDIYEHTAAWRAQNVGPVYKFGPLEPETSHSYNPLTFVRRHADFIWEDSRLLAEMMIVPATSPDPFWENEARTVLTAAIAYVCSYNEPEARPMHAVLDILFGGKAWDQMILGLQMTSDVRVMVQHATALREMNEKTRSSVLQTARASLSAWSGERIARVTARSDWNPADLRNGTNATVYIYVRANEVEAYLSLLRVFIGQHIRILTGGPVPPRDAPPILFMLDELPRLRFMPPVDEALNIGRKYGLRLWMFAQSVGQLKAAYENADGMLGACAVRIFMNPSGADGQSEKISEELGYVDSVNDNQRKRLVEAAELSGPAYRDQQIVFGIGARPARAKKDFAWADPEFSRRMSLEPEAQPA